MRSAMLVGVLAGSVIGGVFTTRAVAQPCAPATWVQRSATEPSARRAPAMVYDEARRRSVFFGGATGGDWPNYISLGETMTWDGATWTTLFPNPSPFPSPTGNDPYPRWEHAMVYDSVRKVIVMPTGAALEIHPNNHHINGTWEFDGSAWRLATLTGPVARHAHALTFDAARNRTVFISGKHGWNDTWEWNGTAWAQSNATPITDRGWAAAAYDPIRERTVVFGGFDDGFNRRSDTWEWDGVSWQQVSAAAPAAMGGRNGATMLWDPARERCVLIAGESGTGRRNDVWEWDGSTWSLRPTTGGMPTRFVHAASYDTHRSVIVLACGITSAGNTAGTWELVTDPKIDTPTPDKAVGFGESTTMTVAASGSGTLTYQWRKGRVPLDNAGRFSGVNTPTLTITGAQMIDSGDYDVIVTGSCGEKTRSHGELTVVCRGDFDGNRSINTADLTGFLAAFGQVGGANSPADFNQDGVVNTADLAAFLARFGSGC
ncbi:MAG: hypothetical protein J0L61_09270 [Planctomycetes bacterium]|nr:hypothetical protein [Planctomycetota bacterium]